VHELVIEIEYNNMHGERIKMIFSTLCVLDKHIGMTNIKFGTEYHDLEKNNTNIRVNSTCRY